MHKPCHPLCLVWVPWLLSRAGLWNEDLVSFWTQFRTNYKNMTFQIKRRISCPTVKMLCIAQNYFLYFIKWVIDLERKDILVLTSKICNTFSFPYSKTPRKTQKPFSACLMQSIMKKRKTEKWILKMKTQSLWSFYKYTLRPKTCCTQWSNILYAFNYFLLIYCLYTY